MHRIFWSVALACVLLSGVAVAQAPGSPPAELRPLLDSMLVAANAHDTDRFLAGYLHDSTLVLVFNGVVTTGYDQVRALQLKWWNNGASDVVYTRVAPAGFMVLSPGVVVVTDQLASRRTAPDGTIQGGRFTATMVWQKRPQGWRAVAVHESTAR